MTNIMGYVIFKGVKEPVIWERESDKYVFNVRRILMKNGVTELNRKLFEDKMSKKEIIYIEK